MNKVCVRCKNQPTDSELQNIRGDEKFEGHIIANFPEVLQLSENDPIELCMNCIREITDKNNNSQIIRKESQKRSRYVSIGQSNPKFTDEIPIPSESIASFVDGPLTTSVNATLSSISTFNVDKLKEPGKIEILVPNDKNVQEKVRNLVFKSMPATIKKQKLHEMLGSTFINYCNDQQSSSSNSQSETVIHRPKSKSSDEYGQILYRRYASQPTRIAKTHRNDSIRSFSSNDSQSSTSCNNFNPAILQNINSQSGIVTKSQETNLPPARNRQEIQALSQQSQEPSQTVPLYNPDSSSDSDRVRNTSVTSSNGSRRNSQRISSKTQSESSDDSRTSVRRSADRQTSEFILRQVNDGNDHSNVAAPRRVNYNVPIPSATRPQNHIKMTTGG